MKRTLVVALALASLAACQSNDASQQSSTESSTSTNNSALMNTALNTAISMYSQQSTTQNSPIVDTLQSQLSVTPEQAVGGVGALLSVAQNSLGSSEQKELNSLIPGTDLLSSSGLVNMITSMDSVKTAFTSLGIDPALVTQFAPIILQGLQSQGASDGLTSALSSLWQ